MFAWVGGSKEMLDVGETEHENKGARSGSSVSE